MALPAESTSDLPFGLDIVNINSVDYTADAIDIPNEATRTIVRGDEFGDRKDFMIRKTTEPIEGSMTLQRATNSTPVPASGTTFTYDADEDGTDETYIVKDAKLVRSTDAFDTIEISLARIDI
jgi:hypothetical protein